MSVDSALVRKAAGTTPRSSQSRKVSLETSSFNNQSANLNVRRAGPLHFSNSISMDGTPGSNNQGLDRAETFAENEILVHRGPFVAYHPMMPMHPADAGFTMGMDRMMDFPPPRFVSFVYPGSRNIPTHVNGENMYLSGAPLYLDSHHGVGRSSIALGQISNPTIPLENKAREIMGLDTRKAKAKREPSSSSFPNKLYKILANPMYHPYIAWLPHGRAWRILKPKEFCEKVLPKYFRSDRYASFMRQVNGWGFKRISDGQDQNAYYHESFLRGFPQVCAKMRRPGKVSDVFETKEMSQQPPDFYKISKYAPLPELEPCESESPSASTSTSLSDRSARLETKRWNKRLHADDSNNVKRTKLIESPSTPAKNEARLFATPGSSPRPEAKYPYCRAQATTSLGDAGYRNSNNVLDIDVSPTTGWEKSFPIYNPGKVTPPRVTQDNVFGCDLSSPLSPSIWSPVETENTDLSEADLCYLEHQNRILLGQHTL